MKDQRFRVGVNLNGAHFPRARGGVERRAPPADRPARAGWAALRQFLFREFFLDIFPATLVSRATRNQTDPLAPLGRRCGCWPPSPFLEFGLRAGAAAAAPDSMMWSAAPGERSEVRGLRQQPARNRTDTTWPQSEVLKEPRVQLKLGLNRTKRIPTSVPTTQPQSSKVSCAAGPARPDGELKRTSTQLFEPGCCRTPPPSSRRQRHQRRAPRARAKRGRHKG